MIVSEFLAQAFGAYFVVMSLAVLVNRRRLFQVAKELLSNAALSFVTGIFTLILGIILVLSHNVWVYDWTLIITIFSWLTLIKGASFLLVPTNKFSGLVSFYRNETILMATAIGMFLLGCFLISAGM